ncbi:MAG: hypothetical protein Q9162_006621 [Coniocarpon cinnabarinum]
MSRQYDLVLLGATGFTGKLTAEYIHTHFPSSLKWAIAGRSESKLKAVNKDLEALDETRKLPDIEIALLGKDELINVSNRARVLINTVGPYHKFSTPVVEACAETGTHYLDVTGEAPWTGDMVASYHETAQRSGAIMIPQCGIESTPADILTYVLACSLRKRTQKAVREVMISLTRMSSTPSGGTIASAMGVFKNYSAAGLQKASAPQAQFPAGVELPPSPPSAAGLLRRLTGLRVVPDLGLVSLPMLNAVDIPIVQRTWALLEHTQQAEAYGPNFRFSNGINAGGYVGGLVKNVNAVVGRLLLSLPPIRWLIKRFLVQPGNGPSKEVEANGKIEMKGVAVVDADSGGRYVGAFRWRGGMYALTAVTVAEAAATLLYAEDGTIAKRLGGGMCTPATLSDGYVQRLQDAGVKLDVSYQED